MRGNAKEGKNMLNIGKQRKVKKSKEKQSKE